ncbi:hypothetical protein [Priestia megaterium]
MWRSIYSTNLIESFLS